MGLRISGKNIDIGEALRGRVEGASARPSASISTAATTGHVTVEREGSGFRSDCRSISTPASCCGRRPGQDAYQSFDAAAERIEKRLRRYKRRLKEHHGAPRGETDAGGGLRHRRAATRTSRSPSTTIR